MFVSAAERIPPAIASNRERVDTIRNARILSKFGADKANFRGHTIVLQENLTQPEKNLQFFKKYDILTLNVPISIGKEGSAYDIQE
jgi:hypothetical protein